MNKGFLSPKTTKKDRGTRSSAVSDIGHRSNEASTLDIGKTDVLDAHKLSSVNMDELTARLKRLQRGEVGYADVNQPSQDVSLPNDANLDVSNVDTVTQSVEDGESRPKRKKTNDVPKDQPSHDFFFW